MVFFVIIFITFDITRIDIWKIKMLSQRTIAFQSQMVLSKKTTNTNHARVTRVLRLAD